MSCFLNFAHSSQVVVLSLLSEFYSVWFTTCVICRQVRNRSCRLLAVLYCRPPVAKPRWDMTVSWHWPNCTCCRNTRHLSQNTIATRVVTILLHARRIHNEKIETILLEIPPPEFKTNSTSCSVHWSAMSPQSSRQRLPCTIKFGLLNLIDMSTSPRPGHVVSLHEAFARLNNRLCFLRLCGVSSRDRLVILSRISIDFRRNLAIPDFDKY
jgi:hypothetical protein